MAGRVTTSAEELADYLREETSGGKLLLLATAAALVWANVAGDSYASFWDTHLAIGPEWLKLDLSLEKWAGDGLLAIFFFVAGLELKRELTDGELADPRAAALPVFAAVGGVVVPALIMIIGAGSDALNGGVWAVPTATDIAFALGVLAIAGSALPSGVRASLLSIAVVDDLIAITLIAILFTAGLQIWWLLGGLLACVLYRLVLRAGAERVAIAAVLAILVWICIHASGVHATVAGILLAAVTPVRSREETGPGIGHSFEHSLHPLSAGVAVPIFALSAAGISLGVLSDAGGDKIALMIFFALLAGKLIGILGGARLAVATRLGTLPEGVRWGDMVPVAMLGGIGYTVSLLIADLAFETDAASERAAAAVLAAAVVSALTAVVLLRRRSRPAVQQRRRERQRQGD